MEHTFSGTKSPGKWIFYDTFGFTISLVVTKWLQSAKNKNLCVYTISKS